MSFEITATKNFLKISLGVLILALAILTGRWWYSDQMQPATNTDVTQLVRIEEGMSAKAVANNLEENNLIKNALAFRIYLYANGLSGDIQAGLYQIESNLSAADVAKHLISGQTATLTLTINSGMRLEQIKNKLQELGYEPAVVDAALNKTYSSPILKDKPHSASLEGYLFADTYIVDVDTPVDQIIELIISNTESKITAAQRSAWASRGLNLHQGLILASIVQKEVSTLDDQRKVAQVFYKRLGMGMKLEADPTFEYGASLLGVAPSPAVDSPYNTYIYPGLPPGPIATVELSAIEATANPADTNYLFFLADKAGNTHFTDSIEKHKQNIEVHLR